MIEWPMAVTLLTAVIASTLAIITTNRKFLRDTKEDLREEVQRMRAEDIEEVQEMAETFREGLEVLKKQFGLVVEDDGEGVIVNGVWQPYDAQYPREDGY